MCGIAGILRWGGPPPERSEITAMTEALAHRGPDDQGVFQRGPVALGHRRLSIIDLTGGKQPMEEGQVCLTYNGEIYNYRHLRRQLEERGHRFHTQSDTEVLLRAYQEWDLEFVHHLRGMFAFGLADFRRQRLLLGRDHFGIKPLYYRLEPGYLAFASELTSLLQVQDASPRGNLTAVEMYLRFFYIPAPATIYHRVFKLPPASLRVFGFDGSQTPPRQYWSLHFQPDPALEGTAAQEQVEATVQAAVEAHLVADVPFGVFLSGGIDSTLVALCMSRALNRPVPAFSIGFGEQGYSELAYAQQAARTLGLELHQQILQPESLKILPDLVSHYGEPFGDSSCIPTWYVSQLARTQVPMVLSGDGGDEAFGGYYSYLHWLQRPKHLSTYLGQCLRTPGRTYGRQLLAYLGYLTSPHPYHLEEWQGWIPATSRQLRRRLWRPEYRYLLEAPCPTFTQASRAAQGFDRLGYAQYLDYQTYLPGDILPKVDIASMYHGLEVRTPLVDVQVVELAARLPARQRIHTGVSKRILKEILGQYFPREFVHRPKQGFSLPVNHWFRPGGQGRQQLTALLAQPPRHLTTWLNPSQIGQLVAENDQGTDRGSGLWLVLVLGLWLDQHPGVDFS